MDDLDPVDVLALWLEPLLKNDPQLAGLVTGVWPDEAPEGTGFPVVIWSVPYAEDANAAGGSLGVFLSVQVKTVESPKADSTARANARTARRRINALLVDAQGTTEEGVRYLSRAAGVVNVLEPSSGSGSYRHRGRRLRVFLSTI